jgi:hypothetical protein
MPTPPRTELTVAAETLQGPVIEHNGNPLLARTVTPTDKPPYQKGQKKEPQFRALCRILGWDPRELLPADLCDAVDAVYEFGQKVADVFQVTPFDTAKERDDALVVMRAYAETPGDQGYTIYTQNDADPAKLVWKVTKRRTTTPRDE